MNLRHILLILLFSPFVLSAQIQPSPSSSYPPATQSAPLIPSQYNDNISINYIRTWEAMRPNTNPSPTDLADPTKYKQATAYFDGLGRPLQEVIKGASPDGLKDLVSMHIYDDFGRETISYLPYPAIESPYPNIPGSTDKGRFKLNPFTATTAYYNTNYTDQRPFSQTEIEPSPLNRPTKTMAPGNSWVGSGRGIEKQYLINALSDEVRIWNIGYNANIELNIPTSTVIYPAGELYKNVTKDEHQKQIVEYIDKDGRVILKKVQLADNPSANHTGWLCNYYVYDDFGLLRFVMQPKAVEQLQLPTVNWVLATDVVSELCFRYEYDARQRMIAKKVPGAGWVYMCYDKRDRLVYIQDANMRTGASFPITTGQTGWMVTFYDALNRPKATALYQGAATDTRAVLQAQLDGLGGDNPTPTIAESNLYHLSYTYYDDYTFPGVAGFDGTQLTTTQSNYQLIDEVADNTTQATSTRGLVTGTKIRVLVPPSGGGGGETWLNTTTYYDVNGRPLQAVSTNHKGGTDRVTTQYSFTGKVLSTVSSHSNPSASIAGTGATIIEETTLYKNNYAISTRQRLSGHSGGLAPEWHTISTIRYDDMGKAKRKEMGNGYTMEGNPEMFFTNFSYNIRGWLTGINKTEYETLSPVFGSQFYKAIFSQKLSYDYGFQVSPLGGSGGGYFNGNISGIQWAHAGDKMKRAFGYDYDAANRLKKADFTQNENVTWTNATVNYNVNNLTYDANGNILSMTQWGLKLGSSDIIDQMTYSYTTPAATNLTNKLRKVIDSHDDPTFKIGDFKDGTNANNDDYDYDLNGNLKWDKNKDISTIAYNYLNLPQTITVTGKGTITYTYDATGNKLQKLVTPTTGTATTTDYMGAFQYQNNELQHIAHAEGRVRYAKHQTIEGQTNEYYWNYDFYYKDHLGNIRETVTEQVDVSRYNGSFETSVRQNETSIFRNISQTAMAIADIPNYPTDGSDNNQITSRLNGSYIKTGASTTLKVMAGDKIAMGVKYWYPQLNGIRERRPPRPDELFASIGSFFSSGASGFSSSHPTSVQLNAPTSPLMLGLTAFLGTHTRGNDVPNKPSAYLNWVLLDEQFNYVPLGSGYLTVAGFTDALMQVMAQQISIPKSGYLFIFLSNETVDYNVYFDDLVITHTSGPLVQEDDYYPFGLEMKMLGSRAAGKQENKNLYQGYEKNNDFDLNLYETFYRSHDPQIGRFWQIDPRPIHDISPFAAMGNNPVSLTDFLGDTSIYFNGKGVQIGVLNRGSGVTAVEVGDGWSGLVGLAIGAINANKDLSDDEVGAFDALLQGTGTAYDISSISQYYDENGNTESIKKIDGTPITAMEDFKFNGKSINPKSLKAEASVSLVMKGGKITVGKNEFKNYDLVSSYAPNWWVSEPGFTAAFMHTHPDMASGRVEWKSGFSNPVYNISPNAGPSTTDMQTAQANMKYTNGVRNVVADKRFIYLINGTDNQTIKIPR